MSIINFQSLTELKKIRNLEKEERQHVLDKAKEKYEKELRREKEAKERGETTWMLPSVEEKINPKEKKKKRKKEKKEKKAKKKKKKKSSSSSSSSESEEEEEKQANVWIEKSSIEQPPKREEWMEISSLFKTQTREQIKISDGSSRALKKLEERKRKEEVNKPGTHARELNPYYKDGGVGLPSRESGSSSSSTLKTSSFDAAWLRKALQRAKDQAVEEGKTLEDVATERWGSLDTFYKLLNEAEEANLGDKDKKDVCEMDSKIRGKGNEIRDRKDRNRYEYVAKSRRNRSRSKERSRSRESRRKRSRSTDKSKNINNDNIDKRRADRSRSRDRNRHKKRNNSSSSSSSSSSCRKRGRSRSRSRNRSHHRKSRSSSDSGSRSDSVSSVERKKDYRKMQHSSKESKSEKAGKLKMWKPSESDDEMSSNRNSLFLKPDNSMNFSVDSFQSQSNSLKKNTSASWRKKVAASTSENILPSEKLRSSKSSSDSSSSSGSDSDDHEREKASDEKSADTTEKMAVSVPVLTDKEMNQLAAKLTKAELLGNTELVEKLKSKLEAARNAREKHGEQSADSVHKDENNEDDVIILTRTDKTGFTRPLGPSSSDDRGNEKKKKKAEMFADGKRTSYFEDDFKTDLHSMFEKEKTTSAEDQIAALENLPRYSTEKLSDDFDVDDMFIAKVAPKQSGEKERERDRKKAIWEHQRSQKVLDSCHFCIDNKLMKKHLIVALGKKCYVSLPYHQSLTEGHCTIVPHNHVPCGTQADEDLWEEIMSFRQALVRMFSSNDEDCVFFETATKLHQTPHMVLQCIPLPKETGDLAPIYFKKAILECDEEWAQNKKLVDLKGRNVRKAVPKGLPYFFVDFGMTSGFAHVIENEHLFPNNFAQEIIGGMIDADFSLYRKPKAENFDQQRKKVLKFGKMFQPFDPTEN